MQMYFLTQGLQNGMVKVDPHYMNKAIIEKMKNQNSRWEQSTLSEKLLEQTQASQRPRSAMTALNTFGFTADKGLKNGLHEMH